MQLPADFSAASATEHAAEAIAAVMSSSQAANGDAAAITADKLRSDWSGVDLETASLVVRDSSGAIAGYADIDNHTNVVITTYTYVAPEYRGRGVGTALRQWSEDYARQAMDAAPVDDQVLVQQFIPSPAVSAHQLLEDAGYRAVRETFVMETSLDRLVPEPVWPAGIVVRPFTPGQDDRATFEAVEDAFRDLWGRPPGTFERFAAMISALGFDPALWLLALDGDEIAATGLARGLSDEGWIDVIGVRRPWRRRGLGLALLLSLFAASQARGMRTAALSVDAESLTGAPRLYGRAGMTVRMSYLRYRKELRPGRDPAALASESQYEFRVNGSWLPRRTLTATRKRVPGAAQWEPCAQVEGLRVRGVAGTGESPRGTGIAALSNSPLLIRLLNEPAVWNGRVERREQ